MLDTAILAGGFGTQAQPGAKDYRSVLRNWESYFYFIANKLAVKTRL